MPKHSVRADINYLPAGKECAPGRYTALRTPGLTLGVGVDMFEVTISPSAVGGGQHVRSVSRRSPHRRRIPRNGRLRHRSRTGQTMPGRGQPLS